MTIARILAVGTSNPNLRMSQSEVHRFYKEHDLMPQGQRDLYERLLLAGQIEGRYLGLDSPEQILDEDQTAQIERFTLQGRAIGSAACRNAMAAAGIGSRDVGALVVNTCTGYLCPGFSSYLLEDLGLENDVKAIDIMGMGCGSAIPNIECGSGLLARLRGRKALSVSIEICSATHYIDDEAGLTVSNCIFGDGAAASVLASDGPQAGGLELLDFETGLYPQYRETLRYTNSNGYLRNQLGREVPVVGAKCLEKVVDRILTRNRLAVADIGWWAIHAGGTEVLRQVGRRLGIGSEKLQASIDVFRHYGNMSSPTVIFALQELMRRREAEGPGLILAFGAGFSAFAALARGGVEA
jgi:predicted naringenin-chalcone synthase